MDARKDYVAPAIAAEDVLEQASLACNLTSILLDDPGPCPGQPAAFKGGNWDTGLFSCDNPLFQWGEPGCTVSLIGVPLS